MKAQRFFIALTIINLGLTLFLLLQVHHVNSATVEASGTLPVLRGSSLEIVDEGLFRQLLHDEPVSPLPGPGPILPWPAHPLPPVKAFSLPPRATTPPSPGPPLAVP